jgi:hypothetical protein
VTNATKILSETEVQADRLGVANVQIAIGFWWKTSPDSGQVCGRLSLIGASTRGTPPAASGPVARRKIRFDSVADEI